MKSKGQSVKVPIDRYRRLRRIALSEGRSITFLIGKAIDLFLIGYAPEAEKKS
jgi:hypothetical protein